MRHILCLTMVLALLVGNTTFADEEAQKEPKKNEFPLGTVQLDETVISGNQELPKVLYILPWQQPTGLPNIKLDPQFSELKVFRSLYPPAYRRELDYYKTLDDVNTED